MSEPTVVLTVRVARDEAERLDAIRRQRGITRTELLRKLISRLVSEAGGSK